MPRSVTLAVRVPQETRQLLEKKVALGDFPSLTALLRDVLTKFALDYPLVESNRAEACKQQEVYPLKDNSRPWRSFARNEPCSDCPYHEQPVTSRESVVAEVSSSKKDLVAEMIDELFEKSEKP